MSPSSSSCSPGAAAAAGHPRRDAVNAYFVRVDRAELPFLTHRGQINAALQHFSMSANPPAEVQALRRARSQILAAERRVSAIKAPPDALKIHADLLTMLQLEASLTGDLLMTTHYVPQFKQALLPLAPAGTALARDLRTAKGWNAQANAFAVYRAKLEPVIGAARHARRAAGARTDAESASRRRSDVA